MATWPSHRDRWVDDPYYPPPPWHRRLEDWIELRLMERASALITESEPMAADYRAKYGKLVAVIYNGYDPDDFAGVCPARVHPHIPCDQSKRE